LETLRDHDSGEISADEFVSTCFKLQGSAQRVDTERIYAGLKRLGAATEEMGSMVLDVLQGMGALKSTIEQLRVKPVLVPRSASSSPLRKATTFT